MDEPAVFLGPGSKERFQRFLDRTPRDMPPDFASELREFGAVNGFVVTAWQHPKDPRVALGYRRDATLPSNGVYEAALKRSIWFYLEIERLAELYPEEFGPEMEALRSEFSKRD